MAAGPPSSLPVVGNVGPSNGAPEVLPRSQLTDSQKWKFAFDNMLQSGSIGVLAGGLAGLLLMRARAARVGTAALGCGAGVGKAYVDARYLFGHDTAATKVWIATVSSVTPSESK